MTLTDFLLARIAEDEEIASACESGVEWHLGPTEQVAHDVVCADVYPSEEDDGPLVEGFVTDSRHIARWDPARVLAECEAKRHILEIYEGGLNAKAMMTTADDGSLDAITAIAIVDSLLATLDGVMKLHAAVHADHSDYQPEWKPER